MDSTTHFIVVTGKSLSRLTALMEQAAPVLDARGGRRLRGAMLKELHFALGCLQAANNSTIPGFDGSQDVGNFLMREVLAMRAIKPPLRGRRGPQLEPAQRTSAPHLRVVGGTDMEGGAA